MTLSFPEVAYLVGMGALFLAGIVVGAWAHGSHYKKNETRQKENPT